MTMFHILFAICYHIGYVLSSNPDPNCSRGVLHELYGICGTIHCPNSCDSYCDAESFAYAHCCCVEIIKSGHSCNTNSPSCLIETGNTVSDYIIFGFQTNHSNASITADATPILLTLFWDNYQYECAVYVSNTSSFLSCDTSDTDTKSCPVILSSSTVSYGLQIDYEGNTTLFIDKIIVREIQDNILSNLYIIDHFSSNSSVVDQHHGISMQNQHNLVIFKDINTTQVFSMDMEGYTQPQTTDSACSKENFVATVPETINSSLLSEEICVFGAHHSFLDGTYRFIAWDLDENGAIYYDENEHKYIYGINTAYYLQWQIHEDYTSESSYSICNMETNDEYRYYVQYCNEWKTDINLLNDIIDDDELQYDEFVSVKACDDIHTVNDDSITFEIETLSWNDDIVADIISLTLYWNDTKYKCSIYPTRYDYDYSCNTKLSAIQCESKHTNDIEYGLQIDVFTDDKDHMLSQDVVIESITIKYMEGNVLRDTHTMQHFCVNDDIDIQECADIVAVTNHTLITFSYVYSNDTYSDVDALHAHIEHTQSLSQCIPEQSDGYPIQLNKYILVQTNLSWMDAAIYCRETFNTTLGTIIEEEDLLNAVASRELNNSNQDVWIGLNDIDNTGIWSWDDGTACDYAEKDLCEYDSNWVQDKPDDHDFENCAEMSGVSAMGKYNNDYCNKKNIFLCHNLISHTLPDWVHSNVSQDICVFGSRHSFLDGTYQFIAWNMLLNAPIYYDEYEHKYLYPARSNDEYQWQIHENYLSDDFYSHCELEEGIDILYVSHCEHWKADISASGQTKDDPLVTVRACDDIHNDSDLESSITFEIETDWDITGGAITLTLYWQNDTYKCTVYSDDDDQDYSCNTALTARKCDDRWTDNPVQYGLQIDVFGVESSILYVKSITIKYMIGNVVRDSHIIEHFCDYHDTQCVFKYDLLDIYNHTLVNFTYQHSNETYLDIDALHAHIEHGKTFSICVPDGYDETEYSKYILIEQEKSWMEAKDICAIEYNATLATIMTDDDLLKAVALRELNHPYEAIWIGLNAREYYRSWEWDDGTICEYCEHHDYWADNYPFEDVSGDEVCAEMSGYHAMGYFTNVDCDDKHIFLCNVATLEPTRAPTHNPTPNPTNHLDLDDIAILMHPNVSEDNPKWLAFIMHNMDLSCGGHIIWVQISDTYPYEWVNYTSNISGYYIFELDTTFDPPISVQIAREYHSGTEILNQSNVIEDLIGGEHYDFRDNFCKNTPLPITETSILLWSLMAGVIFIFSVIALTGWLDARCCRKNDHFVITAILSSLFQLLDMITDIFFCIEVGSRYQESVAIDNDNARTFLIISIASVTFIALPVLISIFQLHRAAHKDWINHNRIRNWLKTWTTLLYTVSIVTGSSFNAIQIFNSNLYNLDVFYMGLHKQHIMKFHTKKLHSIILFENMPQLALSIWYMWTLRTLNLTSLTQIFFSLISIIVTVITIILQTNIDKTQDEVHISIDISGEGVLDNRKRCKNHTNWLKRYLAHDVLGVNAKWIEIQKPYVGGIVKGLRLEMYISFLHEYNPRDRSLSAGNRQSKSYSPISPSNVGWEKKFKESLKDSIRDGSLKRVMKQNWEFNENQQFEVRFHKCVFEQKNKSKTEAIAMTATPRNHVDDIKEEEEHLILDNWNKIVTQTSVTVDGEIGGASTELI